MRLSEGAEWAAHCVSLLASLPEGAALPAAKLAEFHDVPAPYLAKSLQALAGAGIVASLPGRRGGYRLGRPATEITLLDVVLAVEGDERFFRCTEIRKRGPSRVAPRLYSPMCGIAAAMHKAEAAWRASLAETSIADLAKGAAEQPQPAREKAAAWLGATVAGRYPSSPSSAGS